MILIVSSHAAGQGFAYGKGVNEVPEKMAKAMLQKRVATEPTSADNDDIKQYLVKTQKWNAAKALDASKAVVMAKNKLEVFENRVKESKEQLDHANKWVKESEAKAIVKAKANKPK